MSDNLTVEQLTESVRQLAEAVKTGYDAGDMKSATLQRIADNQATLARQFDDHRQETNRRFDSLGHKVDQASEKADEAIDTLRTKKNGDPILVRLDGHDKDKAEREKSKADRKDFSLKIVAAVVIALLLAAGSLTWQAFKNQRGLSDEEIERIINRLNKAAPKAEAEPQPEPPPEPPPRKPRNVKKPKPPTLPISKGTLAERKDHVANGRTGFSLRSDGKLSETRKLARP